MIMINKIYIPNIYTFFEIVHLYIKLLPKLNILYKSHIYTILFVKRLQIRKVHFYLYCV